MVDFPKRKKDFRVRTWSGACWEPLERKKRNPNVFTRLSLVRTAQNPKFQQKLAKLSFSPYVYRMFAFFC